MTMDLNELVDQFRAELRRGHAPDGTEWTMFCEDCDIAEGYEKRAGASGAAFFHRWILRHDVSIDLIVQDG